MNLHSTSTLTTALALVALLAVALAAGCTSAPSGPNATKTSTLAVTAAGTIAGTVTTAGSGGSGSGAVTAVSYDRLIPYVPKTAGVWTLEKDAQGMTMKDSDGRDYTWVTGEYTKSGADSATGSIVIQDAAVANTPFKQQWGTFRSYESTDGWWRAVTVKGQPGWKFHDNSSNDYGQWVLAGDRYIVYVTVEGGTEADLDALVNAIDFAGLAGVK